MFEQPVSEACKYLVSEFRSKKLPVEAICPVLQQALSQYFATVDRALSSHVLALLAELQATKAPPVLGRELLLAVIALQAQGTRPFPAQPFTAYFCENWEELPAMLLKPFSQLIDREAGPQPAQ